MRLNFKLINLRILYNFFYVLALVNFFFSTANLHANTFSVDDIEISTPFEINFSKKEIIDRGFVIAFDQLILSITQTDNQEKIRNIPIAKIKTMIETFSVKEEKFIDEVYYLSMNVSFNKKKIFKLLESRNIFPSLPIKKNIFFIPIIINEDNEEISIFSESFIYKKWNKVSEKYHLINYVLPTEDLEDFNIIKTKSSNLENYDFQEIISKYNLEDYIIMIIFRNKDSFRVLNKMKFNETMIIKNMKFTNLKLNNNLEINEFIKNLKTVYENNWKSKNQMNTSVKLPITISVSNDDNSKISDFEKTIESLDFLYDFYIYKFNNKSSIYKIVFNGSPENFLKVMKNNNYEFNTQKIIWTIK